MHWQTGESCSPLEAISLFYVASSFQNMGVPKSTFPYFPVCLLQITQKKKKNTSFHHHHRTSQNISAWAMTSTACPGKSNFVCIQKLCFCYSLQFAAKQTLCCTRQPLLEDDTDIWFRIFLFMQWLTYRKFYNQNSLSPWPFFLLFTNTMTLPSNLFSTSLLPSLIQQCLPTKYLEVRYWTLLCSVHQFILLKIVLQ